LAPPRRARARRHGRAALGPATRPKCGSRCSRRRPNCRAMIEDGVLPLVKAGLSNDRVQISVLPWASGEYSEDGRWRSTAERNNAYDILCAMQLCARRQAAALAGAAVERGVQFMACQMKGVQAQDGANVSSLWPEFQQCSQKAGFAWQGADGLSECSLADGFHMLSSEDFRARMAWVYQQPHWTNPPYIFINGRPLNCASPTYCDSIWTPDGDKQLAVHGSLLDIACSFLRHPRPQACPSSSHSTSAPPGPATVTKFCETCYEAGTFHWTRDANGHAPAVVLLVAIISGSILSAFVLVAWFSRRHADADEGDAGGPLLPAE